MLSTSHTLLQRARRLEPAAWERLCRLYGPIVYGWCRRAGLQDADAADATQDVFRSVLRSIGQFQQERPDGRFRGWLRTIVVNQVRLHHRQANRIPGTDGWAEPESQEPNADDSESRAILLRRALELIRGDFTEPTWHAFVRTSLENGSIQEAAEELGMAANAVRQARFRVMQRLRQELAGLL